MKKVYSKKFDYEISKVVYGGIVAGNESQEDANYSVDYAIDKGINYFDVAPTYFDAEEKMGVALKGKRKDIFLACKTEGRAKKSSRDFLENSLRKLQTDYFDLYQFHAVYTLDDVETIFGKDGAMETYQWAKKEGYIKNIGFSAHSTEAALALMEGYDFDSIMFPFNFVSLLKNSYGKLVLKKALEKEMTVLGIKSMALTTHKPEDHEKYPKSWYHPIEDIELARKAVKFSLSQGVTSIIPPGNFQALKWAIEIVNGDLTLSNSELEELKQIAQATEPLFPTK